MHRITIISEAIRSAAYDEARRALIIEFIDRDVYEYSGVPSALYRSFIQAESKGRYFSSEIRNRFPTRKLPRGRS